MKKILLLATALISAFLFSACEDNGGYKGDLAGTKWVHTERLNKDYSTMTLSFKSGDKVTCSIDGNIDGDQVTATFSGTYSLYTYNDNDPFVQMFFAGDIYMSGTISGKRMYVNYENNYLEFMKK